MRVNAATAELCGIILGDGNLSKYLNRITITESSDDLFYFYYHIIPLFRKCFPQVNPIIIKDKRKQAYQLIIENRDTFNFFIQQFELQRERKDTAHIPSTIIAHHTLIPHFVRGLFDTDGCLKFDKQARTHNYYPRIRFALMDSPLAHGLGMLLQISKFDVRRYVCPNHGYSAENIVQYEISGAAALERWMRTIRPANLVQIAKYCYWKEHGRHIPHLSLAERITHITDARLVRDKIALPGFEPRSAGPKPAMLDHYTTGLSLN